ncbi:MAG TPA: mycothione reductase [Marmoricola sp.]|nr:mycothione reductase [Marmoricola sp.]
MTHYDLAVIGTGSGNMIVNRRFADWRVAIVEENLFGGTCLNVGCIPTKMFVYPADVARVAADGPRLGVDTAFTGVRWTDLRDRVFARVERDEVAARAYREQQSNVDVVTSRCTFVDDHTLRTAAGERITADKFVIAAGSRVSVPDVPGLDEVEHHTSDTVMRLDEVPRRMTIVGGGYVAAEFAHVFSAFGTEVTVVQRGPVLVKHMDEDVCRRFGELAARQWDVRLKTEPTHVRREGGDIVVSLSDGDEVHSDVLLMATGRASNADRLGLEHTGVEVRDGLVVVDEHQRTTVEHIWALGDVCNRFQLKHVANHESRVVKHNLLHPDDPIARDHRYVPSTIFTSPQIAAVGLTSQQAREQDIEHVTATCDYGDVAYGWAMEDEDHFVKVLADTRGDLLGAHIIGPQSSLLLQPLVQALSFGTNGHQMAREQYWAHPILAEVVENALLRLARGSVPKSPS